MFISEIKRLKKEKEFLRKAKEVHNGKFNYCKPPQKLDYLKQNNSDKINQEHLCEKVSLVRNRL